MELFLHIGAEKTGTSSLQQFFKRNCEMLEAESILYSQVARTQIQGESDSHTALAAAAQAPGKIDDLRQLHGVNSPESVHEFRGRLSQALVEEARLAGCERAIFSSEHLSSRLVSIPEVETLAKMLKPVADRITVVVYVRRQDDFLCSTYSTDVKSGFTGPIALPGEGLRQSRYNYYVLLERWAAVFGKQNIVCRIYEKSGLKNGDIVDDFADVIGLHFGEDFKRFAHVNDSLDVAALEFLRLFNHVVPRMNEKGLNPARGNLIPTLQEILQGPSPTLPETELAEFMRYFERSNRKVALEYFDSICKTGDPLFGEADMGKNRAQMRPLTTEEAVAIAAHLWERKQERINVLRARIAHLEKKGGTMRKDAERRSKG
ncbi:MAG TPA: hypothetical protein VHX61_17950 [Rhizomicrobium sp.]|jgi:hypothetical protein|nr:hypothetical protein [Rhizomicrobium sp.]